MEQNVRSLSHEVAVLRRAGIIQLVLQETHFKIDLRAGSRALIFDPKNAHNNITRVIRDNHVQQGVGLDMIITAPDGEKRWVVLFPWKPSDRKKVPKGNYLRTKAPENGFPQEKRVRHFYRNQWAVLGYFNTSDDALPVAVTAFPFQAFLDRGLSKCDNPKGFCFPGHKGRRNTIHWFTHCWNHNVTWGHSENSTLLKATANSVQTSINTMFQEKKA